jgi:hypothetical protein
VYFLLSGLLNPKKKSFNSAKLFPTFPASLATLTEDQERSIIGPLLEEIGADSGVAIDVTLS